MTGPNALVEVAAEAGRLEVSGDFAPCPDRRAEVIACVAGAPEADQSHVGGCATCSAAADSLRRALGEPAGADVAEGRFDAVAAAADSLDQAGFFSPCPGEREAVIAYVSGSADERTSAHVAGCLACASAADSLRRAAGPARAERRPRPARPPRKRAPRPAPARRRAEPGGRRAGRARRRLPVAAAVAALVAVAGTVTWIAAGAGSGDARQARHEPVAATAGAVESDDRSGERARQVAAEQRRQRAAAQRREQAGRRARQAAARRKAERRRRQLRERRRSLRAAESRSAPEPVAVATPAPVQSAPPSSESSGGSAGGDDPPDWFLDLGD